MQLRIAGSPNASFESTAPFNAIGSTRPASLPRPVELDMILRSVRRLISRIERRGRASSRTLFGSNSPFSRRKVR
jgi:hypothetical protein